MAATLELVAKENVSEALFKLEQQNLRLIEQVKTLGQASKRAHDDAGAGVSKTSDLIAAQIRDVKHLALAFVGGGGIVGAVEKVISVYDKWEEKMEAIAKKQREVQKTILAGLTKSGDIANAAEIEAKLGTVPGVKRSELYGTFGAVTDAAPTLGRDERVALARASARAAALPGVDAAEFGAQAGAVSKMMPGRDAVSTASATVRLREMAKKHMGELTGDKVMRAVQTMKAAGMDEDTAMAQMIVAMEEGQGRPSALISAAETIDKDMTVIKATRSHRVLTPEEKLKNRFAVADRPERLRLLQSDKGTREAMLGDQAIMYGQIDPARVGRYSQEIRDAEKADLIQQRLDEVGRAPGGPEYLAARARDVATATAEVKIAPGATPRIRARETLDQYMKDKELGPIDWAMAELQYRAGERLSHWSRDLVNPLSAAGAISKFTNFPEIGLKSALGFAAGGPVGMMAGAGWGLKSSGVIDPGLGESFARQEKLLEEQNALIAQQVEAAKKAANQPSGVQANVTSQSESDPNGGARSVNPK